MKIWQCKLLSLVTVNPASQQLLDRTNRCCICSLYSNDPTVLFLDISKYMIISKTLEWATEKEKKILKTTNFCFHEPGFQAPQPPRPQKGRLMRNNSSPLSSCSPSPSTGSHPS